MLAAALQVLAFSPLHGPEFLIALPFILAVIVRSGPAFPTVFSSAF